MSTATLVFELAVQRRSANGSVPLKARIIFKRKKVERLVIRIPEDQLGSWDIIKSRFKPSAPPFYNKVLSDWQQKFDKFLSDNYFELGKLEVEQIAEIFDIEADPSDIFLLTYLTDYYEKVLLKQFDFAGGTPRNFKTALTILTKYLESSALQKIKLKEFDKTTFVKFHESLTDRGRLPKPMKPNSAGSDVKKLRPAFNRAVLLKLISENPTYGTKITTKNPQSPGWI